MFDTLSAHYRRVTALARKLHGDGCTDVPDLWFRPCCDEHDIAYRTGQTAEGAALSRSEADAALRRCMHRLSPAGRFSLLAWVYWVGVRLFGARAWRGHV